MITSRPSQGTSPSNCSIDWQDCLNKANNKVSLAKEMLQILTKELPVFKKDITNAYQQNNLSQLSRHIHKLHGACCYCGIPKLKQIVNTLENHLHTLPPTAIETYIQNLCNEIDHVLHVLNNESYM